MSNLRVIKRRIKSISGIRQITKAMQMVAATKLKRAQARIERARPYINKLDDIMSDILNSPALSEIEHPLTIPKSGVKKIALMFITSDKGLCGSFNASIIRRVAAILEEGREKGIEYSLIPIGKRGLHYFRRRGANILRNDLINIDQELPLRFISDLYRYLVKLYVVDENDPDEGDKFDRVDIVYALFKNAMVHRITSMTLLPLPQGSLQPQEGDYGQTLEYIFEPGPAELFNTILPQVVRMHVFSALAETLASEFGARMVAMRNATDNAGDLIDHLTMERNKARQAAITKELSDIVGGVEALKG
jgi:F-type H+-transporting ATPase subunit gamma